MKVLYDSQIFNKQVYGGISRYFYELTSSLNKCKNAQVKLPMIYSNNHYLKYVNFAPHFSIPREWGFIPNKDKIIEKLERYNYKLIKKELKKQDFDLFHPTYYENYFLGYLRKKPFVLTVHDMIHELFPEQFGGDPTVENKIILAKNATKIIAVSEQTKKDIIRFYDIDPDKIEVTYLANSFANKKILNNKLFKQKLPNKYVLFVGVRGGYKNFKNFIQAMIPLMQKDKELYVIAGGSCVFTDEESAFLERSELKDRVLQKKVTDSNIIELYQNALAFVFPSMYEGFGIPVLESFSCGCPLIVSNRGSLPEVAADASEYIDPYDVSCISDSIEKVIYNEDLRQELIVKGYEQVAKFSWDKTAEKTKKIYESAV